MVTSEKFAKNVDRRFLKHLINSTMVPFDVGMGTDKNTFLKAMFDESFQSITDYMPKKPRKYISIPKNKYAIRMVPTFHMSDYCLYYYVIKELESYLAQNRVENTYGGYRLSGAIRGRENEDFEPDYMDSINENSFNVVAWKQEFGEYQTKLRQTAERMGTDFNFAVSIDVANFYDYIKLDSLESKIRAIVASQNHIDEIYVLFKFLKNWGDYERHVGIPQDEIGDCSRILANFYLQDYDEKIHRICEQKGAVYLRYADDQVFFVNDRQLAEDILYDASYLLFQDGLNINAGKIKEFVSYQAFDDYYGFEVFEKLRFEEQDVNTAFDMFVDRKESGKKFRESSILKRLLHKKIKVNDLSNQKRIKLLSYLWDENFLLFANDHYMSQIYKLLTNDQERGEYLDTLLDLRNRTKFDSYKIQYEKFIKAIES